MQPGFSGSKAAGKYVRRIFAIRFATCLKPKMFEKDIFLARLVFSRYTVSDGCFAIFL